jgi:hypothetical protein
MSSISSYLKQTPQPGSYFISPQGATALNLNKLINDTAASTTSYVSGAFAGYFTTSNTGVLASDLSSGGVTVIRDMGITQVSSGRTFRAVQLMVADNNGSSGWTSVTSGTPGVWQAGVEGVRGAPLNSSTAADFDVLYMETGARGLGLAQGLLRYT